MIGVSGLIVLMISVSSGLVSSQYVPPSPCPDIFSYKREGQQVHGVIRYQPAGQIIHIFMRASFTVAANVTSLLGGNLNVEGSKESVLLKMLRGKALDYRVDFPLTDPLPSLVSVAVNGHVICTGDSDLHGLSRLFTLEHLLYDKGDGSSPIAINFGNSENNRPISNTSSVPEQLSSPTDIECGVVSGGNEQVGLVYYGTAVSPGDWPWLVAIFAKYGDSFQYICGGSLVSDQHVVTAAHCMSRRSIVRPLRDFILKIGAFNLNLIDDPGVSRRGVKAAAVHTNYNSHTLANDALILHLDEPIVFTKLIRPICLWAGPVDLNSIVRKHGSVVGWGGNELGESGTGEPRVASIPIVSTHDCRASRVEFHKLTSSGNTLCAGYRNGTGPCNGDSGSGLYMFSEGRWRLRGVVSVSLRPETLEAKCNLDEYVIFTDVAQYLPWLQQHLQGRVTHCITAKAIPAEECKFYPQSNWSQISELPPAPVSELECGVVSGGNEQFPLIYYGRSVTPGEWPWLVGLFDRNINIKTELQFYCGGNLISNQHVITAALCTRNRFVALKDVAVMAGVFDLKSFSDENVITRGIKDVIVHHGYNRVKYNDNIAILKLDKVLSFTAYIRPVCLWDEDTDVNMVIGKYGMVTGWGETDFGNNDLQVASLPIVSNESCVRSNKDFVRYVASNTFCAGGRNGKVGCTGDYGGGMYMLRGGKWRLRGIISVVFLNKIGVRCDLNDYTVFTDVAQYLPWIKQNLYDI